MSNQLPFKANRPLIAATRTPLSIDLIVKHGNLPTDWHGHVFVTSPAGSVNSGGLPFPPDTQETGSPIMNGDAYFFRFDLLPDKVHLLTNLLKPACYFADEATKQGNTNGYGMLFHFNNMGMTRMALDLGSRNLLNTAVTPFRFPNDPAPRLIACYDAGRPWEIDPDTIQVITPIGANSEWTPSTPGWLFPFPIVQSTAHPSFDPKTQEMFLVNFTKPIQDVMHQDSLQMLLHQHPDTLHDVFEKVVADLKHTQNIAAALQAIGQNVRHYAAEDLEYHALQWINHTLAQKIAQETTTDQPTVFLQRWTGKNAPLEKWQVMAPDGKAVGIQQCMHQTTLTRDYIILADATFKFTLDLLFNVPFSSPLLDTWLRQLLTAPQLPYLDLYLIKRSDLVAGQKTVVARPLQQPIPLEAIHFSANYANPNDQITLHLAHNSAACLAEWVRKFDALAPDGAAPVDPEVIGLISTGSMDIGRIGKVVVNAQTGALVSQDYLAVPGNTAAPEQIGAHTWGVGLYTYRDIISPDQQVDTIRHIYWSSYGMDPRLLTQFIYDLYYDYAPRQVSQQEILTLAKKGIPFVLSRQNTATMTLDDFYQFDSQTILKSLQFVPRSAPTPDLDPQMDGYILTTTLVNRPNAGGNNYDCEVWVFDAQNLAQGPVCVLAHPQLDYAFTLHSAWIEQVQTPTSTYKIDIRQDYNALIQQLEPSERRPQIQDMFDRFVYPPMEGKPALLPQKRSWLARLFDWIAGLWQRR
jgi:Retinal pigment epithelial membrane protein